MSNARKFSFGGRALKQVAECVPAVTGWNRALAIFDCRDRKKIDQRKLLLLLQSKRRNLRLNRYAVPAIPLVNENARRPSSTSGTSGGCADPQPDSPWGWSAARRSRVTSLDRWSDSRWQLSNSRRHLMNWINPWRSWRSGWQIRLPPFTTSCTT